MIRKKFDELRLTGALPTPSAVGLRILEITRTDDYEQEELERSIMADPALSGRILKLANSALTSGGQRVEDVPAAARRLGAHTVRTTALGFTLIADNRGGSAERFDYDGYWSRALACATAASSLAQEVGGVESAEAFTCGLLCDVGRLALASVHPERYSALIEGAPGVTGVQLAVLEDREFDIDHYEVAAALLEDWGLPEEFQAAVLAHERGDVVDDGRPESLTRVLGAAKRVAEVLIQGEEESPAQVCALQRLPEAAEALSMDMSRLLAACETIGLAWAEWGEVLGVPAAAVTGVAKRYERASSRQPATCEPPRVGLTDPDRDVGPPDLDPEGTADEYDEGHGTRILLVDDDQRMLKLISHHLRREGYEVSTSETSEGGLSTALEQQPQLVITDWMMPGMSGLELCRTLRQTEAGRRMYVLVVTAREDDERVVEAFGAGADDYIVKPFNPRILLARVRAGRRMVQMREKVEAAERIRLRQVAELGIMTRKLRAAAMTDALTELPNRRYAMKRLKQEWDSSLRTKRPLSVVLADIDHFKQVNDRFGHDAGDAVLREVAALLRRIGRGGDVLCRVGGEEFLSIDVASTADEAAQAAERLRQAVEQLEIEHPGFEGGITLSLGVAERTREMTCVDDLIKAADEALYAAKDGGRNRVVQAPVEGQERRSA